MRNKELKGGIDMEKKYMLGIFALVMVAVLGVSLVSAHGFGMLSSYITDEEKMKMQEQGEAIKTAIESGDYEAWEALMNEKVSRMSERINEDTFSEMQDRHENMALIKEAKETGDWSEVEALKDELGIKEKGFRKGHFWKKGFGSMSGFHKNLVE